MSWASTSPQRPPCAYVLLTSVSAFPRAGPVAIAGAGLLLSLRLAGRASTALRVGAEASRHTVRRLLLVRSTHHDRLCPACARSDSRSTDRDGAETPSAARMKRRAPASPPSLQGGAARGGADSPGGRIDGGGVRPPSPGVMDFAETYPARPESVAPVRAALVDYARRNGASQATLEAVELAVSEAATNVVVHAYADAPEVGVFEVAAALAAGELWILVADGGSGLRARRDSPGLGLGLGLIAQVSDGVDLVNRAGGGLELRMRFALDAVDRGPLG